MQCFIYQIHELLSGLQLLAQDVFLKTNVVQVSFGNAIFYSIIPWHVMHDIVSYILNVIQKSHNTDLLHVNTSCPVVLRKYLQAVKPANISNHIYRILFLYCYLFIMTQYVYVPVYEYVCMLMVYNLS